VLPAEILKKVKLLEISTRKLVNNLFAGEYHTAFKGQGMTFAEFREYVPGDDVRSISWVVTARTGKTFIKKYDEERENTLMLLVDVSGSVDFGSGEYVKGEVMVHLAALLAFSAVRNKDQVGLLMFSDQVEHFVPPRKGHGHVQRILRDLYYHRPQSKGTKISSALSYLSGVLKKKSVVFIVSDFFDEGFDNELRSVGKKHDVVAVVVSDKLERELPAVGVIELQDSETGEMLTVDSNSRSFREEWKKHRSDQIEKRDQMLLKAQVDRLDIDSSGDYADALIQFFAKRKRKRK
jgi:uncharacterized protein (DUF58 family)